MLQFDRTELITFAAFENKQLEDVLKHAQDFWDYKTEVACAVFCNLSTQITGPGEDTDFLEHWVMQAVPTAKFGHSEQMLLDKARRYAL